MFIAGLAGCIFRDRAPGAAWFAGALGGGMGLGHGVGGGRARRAVRHSSRARRVLEASPTPGAELVQCLCELAYAHSQRHDYTDAITIYGDALRHDPGADPAGDPGVIPNPTPVTRYSSSAPDVAFAIA